MDRSAIIERLKAIVGEGYVSEAAEELFIYSRDQGVQDPHLPDWVVMPSSTGEVVSLLELASRERGREQLNLLDLYWDNEVRALVVYEGELIAAGAFTKAGRGLASNIARWNGSVWQAVGGGLNDSVLALAAYECRGKTATEQRVYLAEAAQVISHARPTTVDRMGLIVDGCIRAADIECQISNSQGRVDEALICGFAGGGWKGHDLDPGGAVVSP